MCFGECRKTVVDGDIRVARVLERPESFRDSAKARPKGTLGKSHGSESGVTTFFSGKSLDPTVLEIASIRRFPVISRRPEMARSLQRAEA